MTSYIGREFTHHGLKGAPQKATVIAQAEPKGRSGKILVTVRLEDGTEYKIDARSIPAEIIFAPPTGKVHFGPEDRDYYGDQARMFARHPGWK